MAAIKVHSLVGHQQTSLAIKCLSSLSRTSVEEISFILHDDGSLTQEDILLLQDNLPISSIISRQEADERVLPLLRDYKFCTQYRRDQILGLKLFDPIFFGGPEIYACDSDILFLAPHRGLFAGVLADVEFVFMQDHHEAFCIQPWHIWPFSDLRLRSRLNSGLSAFRRDAYDLEFVEYCLAQMVKSNRYQTRPGWIEQTVWSHLAARSTCLAYDANQIALANPTFQYDPNETIAIHFVSLFRYMMSDYENIQREKDFLKDIRLTKSPWINPVVWYGQKVRKYLRRSQY